MDLKFAENLVGTNEHFLHMFCPRCNHIVQLGVSSRVKSLTAEIQICQSCAAEELYQRRQGDLIPPEKWPGIQELISKLETEQGRAAFIRRMPEGIYKDVPWGESLAEIHVKPGEKMTVISEKNGIMIQHEFDLDGRER